MHTLFPVILLTGAIIASLAVGAWTYSEWHRHWPKRTRWAMPAACATATSVLTVGTWITVRLHGLLYDTATCAGNCTLWTWL